MGQSHNQLFHCPLYGLHAFPIVFCIFEKFNKHDFFVFYNILSKLMFTGVVLPSCQYPKVNVSESPSALLLGIVLRYPFPYICWQSLFGVNHFQRGQLIKRFVDGFFVSAIYIS